jgi:2-polyprenyl-3-methyl-5-hydroxy-6-metoxy-1,4-benzoquinol methylase
MGFIHTAERVSPKLKSDNYVFQRSLIAYKEAAKYISGRVLEIGTGAGYGIQEISAHCDEFITIDKSKVPVQLVLEQPNVRFFQVEAPGGLEEFPDNYFDCVVTFQVIEHIKDDALFLQEIRRILAPGGMLIVSTPNKQMSLSNNPWHVREYLPGCFAKLLEKYFSKIIKKGVFGDNAVLEYYERNKEVVKGILRYDLFSFNKNMPKPLLRIVYDVANRYSRNKLSNDGLEIKLDNYFLDEVNENSFDLFYIAYK